ncbi:MAG TPA: DUF1990 domain-containing protein [Kofleriaceae bacterium]|jgi:uncharacterized protein (UPF0548 family)
MISLRPPADVEGLLREQQAVPLSYAEVGATRGELPAGYRVDRRTDAIGRGDDAFEQASRALLTWQMHEGAGVRVTPHETAREGLTVALVVRAMGLYTISACRVVYVIDEPDRRGFAYGTLRDHPVQGEERFVVSRAPDGEVTSELLAFSRPSSLLFKLGAPVTRRTQFAIGAAYVEALRRSVSRS